MEQSIVPSVMTAAEPGFSLEARAAIDACARRVARRLEAVAEREVAMLQAITEREAAMLRALQEEREAALQVFAEREAETIAGREALAADRAALVAEFSTIEAAARRQESRVQLSVGGSSFFEISRTTLTDVPGSMLEAMFSGRHTIAAGEDGRRVPSHPQLPARLRLGHHRRRDSRAA